MTMNRIDNLRAQIIANATKAQDILKSDDFDPAEAEKLLNDNEVLEQRIKALSRLNGRPDMLPYGATAKVDPAELDASDATKAFGQPTNASSVFGGTRREANLKAYRLGMWFLGAVCGNAKAAQWIADRGIKDHLESNNALGGYLVPEEFAGEIINLVEQYGVFRANARVVSMSSDTRVQPKRSAGITAYFIGEGSSITASDNTFDNVRLTAKKLAVYTRLSNELNEDAAVDLGAWVAQECARAFAQKEDECGFVGDGTSTYGGIVGATEALKAISGTVTQIKGLQVGTGNLYSELVLADFNGVVGRLPQFADTANAAWYVSRTVYHNVMRKLADAASGNTNETLAMGINREPIFMGYPVRIAQAMPSVEANSQVCALLGDLSQGALFGDRRGIGVSISEHDAFQADELALRAVSRFDINAFGVGDTSAAGPIVGLITKDS
jgi:HK97 family phage major capsid protein